VSCKGRSKDHRRSQSAGGLPKTTTRHFVSVGQVLVFVTHFIYNNILNYNAYKHHAAKWNSSCAQDLIKAKEKSTSIADGDLVNRKKECPQPGKKYGSSLFHKLIFLSLQNAVEVTKLPQILLPHVRSSKSSLGCSTLQIRIACRYPFSFSKRIFFCGVAAKVQAGWMNALHCNACVIFINIYGARHQSSTLQVLFLVF
jgi:hypothetical protein